ncbi:lipopolysaccharide heptosyltransferase I [Hydrogenimonas sp.]
MRVALIRLTAMGDVIHTLASIPIIKARRPDIEFTWFVEEKFAPILEHAPHIDRIVPLNLHGLKKRFSLAALRDTARTIRQSGPFDLIVDVQGLLKSALVARVAGKNTAGLDRASAREPLASLLYRHTYPVDCAGIAPMRFASLLSQALEVPITPEMMLAKDPYLGYDEAAADPKALEMLQSGRKNILIVVGASGAHKIYPPERFAQVARGLAEHNLLLIAGSEAERQAARAIEKNGPARLLPPLDLNTLKTLVARCDLLIGADTGPTHLAWALNRPSVVLFGATPTSMMMQTPINVAIAAATPPNPCRFDKRDRSIAAIDPARIVETARNLIK